MNKPRNFTRKAKPPLPLVILFMLSHFKLFFCQNSLVYEVRRTEKESSTDWLDLLAAKDSALTQIGPLKNPNERLHYCIESTRTYHMPVLLRVSDDTVEIPIAAFGAKQSERPLVNFAVRQDDTCEEF